jgi:hypothetical protein
MGRNRVVGEREETAGWINGKGMRRGMGGPGREKDGYREGRERGATTIREREGKERREERKKRKRKRKRERHRDRRLAPSPNVLI